MTTNEFLAVELFGWRKRKHFDGWQWVRPNGNTRPDCHSWDETWSGAGQVIEAMREQPIEIRNRFDEPFGLLDLSPKAIAEAARAALKPQCEHEWVSAKNEIIESGEWCRKCNAVKP